jgi:zinc protease
MSFLSEKTKQALPLFSDVLLHPAFNSEEVAKEKALQLEGIKNFSDSPSQLVYHNVLKSLFKGHPYERHLMGTKKSVKALTPELLKKYYQSFLCPENLVVAVVGDIDTQATLDLFNREFLELKSRRFIKKNFKKPSLPKNVVKTFEVKNKKQAHVAFGFLSNSLYDKDRYTMQLLSSLLSGQGGRLFLELRDKQSLAYTVGSSLIEGVETGLFSTYIGSEPSKVPVAIREMLTQLDKLKNEPIPEAELMRTKNYVIGNHEIDHQKNSAIAMQLCLNELYGKKMSDFFDFEKHIMAITAQDITKAAHRYLTLDKMVLGVVGPQGTTF